MSLFFLGRFAFDDLYISFRYAEHLAGGHGLVWNIGHAPVEGYTNFLLVLYLALVHAVGLDPLTSVQILNILLAIIGAYLLAKLALTFFPDPASSTARAASIITAIAYCANPYVWMNALSGLETVLFTTLILASLCSLWRAHIGEITYFPGFFLAAISVLARPDGVLFGGLAALVFVVASPHKKKMVVLAALVGFVLPVALYEIWRISYFGSPLPNTYYVKVTNAVNVFAGRAYLVSFYKTEAMLLLMLLVGIWRIGKNPVFVTAALWVAGLSLFYLVPTPIQGFYYRFLFSALVMLTLIAIPAVVSYAFRLKENYRWVLLTVTMAAHLMINWRAARGEEVQAVIPEATETYREIGNMLANIPGRDTLAFAYQDAGVIPYYSKMKHYDLVGLNDAYIAREKSTDRIVQYLRAERPEIILLPAEYPKQADSCWSVFRQGHGKMGQLGPAMVESDLLNDYTLVGRYMYIGYDILIYVANGAAQAAITRHIKTYDSRSLMPGGPVPCLH
ncbi:MAG TPA: hypothetical protein VFH43_02965 [Candidatus Kapabacteria bacterium]|nr:hypothetical protein [Candidatus Kapabacteria bacterium]